MDVPRRTPFGTGSYILITFQFLVLFCFLSACVCVCAVFVVSLHYCCQTVVCVGGDFPTPKLQALQRILSSDFLHAVREVYENIYETVDVSGSPEVRANATAKVSIVQC